MPNMNEERYIFSNIKMNAVTIIVLIVVILILTIVLIRTNQFSDNFKTRGGAYRTYKALNNSSDKITIPPSLHDNNNFIIFTSL